MRIILILTVWTVLLTACGENEHYQKADSAADAAREFIRASLDGNYRKANFYMIRDSTNDMLLQTQQSNYQQMSPEEKASYRNASIRPISIKALNDSVTNFTYYHSSNTKDTTTLRILRQQGTWLVDLKSVIKM